MSTKSSTDTPIAAERESSVCWRRIATQLSRTAAEAARTRPLTRVLAAVTVRSISPTETPGNKVAKPSRNVCMFNASTGPARVMTKLRAMYGAGGGDAKGVDGGGNKGWSGKGDVGGGGDGVDV